MAGDIQRVDGRKRRSEAIQLRKSVFGKKLNRLDESKVGLHMLSNISDATKNFTLRKMILSDDSDIYSVSLIYSGISSRQIQIRVFARS